jgi:hypothetical protein
MSDCRIRLKNGGREIELEGDRPFVEEMLSRYASWIQASEQPGTPPSEAAPESRMASGDLPRVPPSFRVTATLSFPEFLTLKSPRTPLGRLLVLAYFLEKYQQRLAYAPAELVSGWHECWPTETLEAQLWEEAVDAGFLEWESPEALTLTYRGQMHVRDGLA